MQLILSLWFSRAISAFCLMYLLLAGNIAWGLHNTDPEYDSSREAIVMMHAGSSRQDAALTYSFTATHEANSHRNFAWQRLGSQSGVSSHRPVTVADIIQMTRVAGSGRASQYYTGASSSDFAVFSPDRKRFVIVVKKGNLERSTNDYSMLLFDTDKVFDGHAPKQLLTIPSSSNSDGIKDTTWLDDNETILFIGKYPGKAAQLYSIRCTSRRLDQLSHQPTNVIGYSASADGSRFVIGVENLVTNLITADALRTGITVSSNDLLYPLIVGHAISCCQKLFFTDKEASVRAKPLHLHDDLWQDPLELFLSPNGRYLVVKTILKEIPPLWGKYTADDVKTLFAAKFAKGSRTFFRRYEIIDTKEDSSRILLDSPIGWLSDVGWSPDSGSVILTGVYLPLDLLDPSEFATRQSHMFTVEIRMPSLETLNIADHDMKLVGWDTKGERAAFRSTRNPNPDTTARLIQYYQRIGSRWELVSSDSGLSGHDLPDIFVEQDLNLPPRIIARDLQTGKRATVLDLNPQFEDLLFGHVEEVRWPVASGKVVSGGLYLPVHYVPGNRYPLVIQTHGFDPHGFWSDGPFTTAFAAQPLASKGFVVLQVPDSHDSMQTTEEAPQMMETYERAIDYLDRRGLIDKSRIGIVGFSRTCLYVEYTLTHSTYHFAAASVADGVDNGYFQYAMSRNLPVVAAGDEALAGATPFGSGLLEWQKRSPGFLLDKVDTPIRLEAHGGYDTGMIVSEWEWFSGLTRLGKPVELIYLPDGDHVLVKPWERMVSQQGNVDWFSFWLNGEEDADPSKTDKYVHWRELRELNIKDGKAPLRRGR